MRKILVILAVLLLVAAPAAAEDRVHLNTGAVLAGRIIEETPEGVTIDVEGLGRIHVLRHRIGRVERESDPPPPPPPPLPETPPDPAPEEPAPFPIPAPETPETPETPDPAPPEPTPPPPEAPPPAPEPPAPAPLDPVDLAFDAIPAGEPILLILAGEDHGAWKQAGRRIVAEVPVRGANRFQAVIDPDAGVLGSIWLSRKDLVRAVRLDGHPERRLVFFHGIGTGSWIRAETRNGERIEGQLVSVEAEGAATIAIPRGDRTEDVILALADLRSLDAVVRTGELESRLAGLVPGEPVGIAVQGRAERLAGRVLSIDRSWIRIETPDGEGGAREERIFRGLPITELATLPDEVRTAFEGLAQGEVVTVHVRSETEAEVVRRSYTGEFRSATLAEFRLLGPTGEERIETAAIEALERPDEATAARRLASRDESESESVLPVLPGMTRAEAERRLAPAVDGVDVMYEGDRVGRVFCRPPFKGPVFGIPVGGRFLDALKTTDLAFSTQITAKSPGDGPAITMVSRTLKPFVVKAYLSPDGYVLALEVSPAR